MALPDKLWWNVSVSVCGGVCMCVCVHFDSEPQFYFLSSVVLKIDYEPIWKANGLLSDHVEKIMILFFTVKINRKKCTERQFSFFSTTKIMYVIKSKMSTNGQCLLSIFVEIRFYIIKDIFKYFKMLLRR